MIGERGRRAAGWALALAASALVAGACVSGCPRDGAHELLRWEETTSRLRGLDFVAPVHMRWIRPEEIAALSREELTARLEPGYLEAYTAAYVALGAFPRETDLLETLLELQADQLVGLYSPHKRTLYVVANPGLIPGGTSMIIVHELVHALQHQHFPLTMGLLQQLYRNDDVVTAVAAAVEGDASFTMLGSELEEEMGRSKRDAEAVRRSFLAELDEPRGVMREVPRLLRVSLIYPYAYGVTLAAGRYEGGGNGALDALLDDPPLSTLRVLYDDEDPVEFVRLPGELLDRALAANGCARGHDNVAGVVTIRVLFEDHGAGDALDALLSAWAGDRFLHVRCAERSELIWLTRWDDGAAARRFASRYAEIAPGAAEAAGLGGVPTAVVQGRTALVLSPGVRDLGALLLHESEVRSYADLRAWLADGCFPESPCPEGLGR